MHQGDGRGEGGHAVLGDLPDEQRVLGDAQTVHGGRARLVAGTALGQRDATGGQEGADPVEPRPAVHMAQVVLTDAERGGTAAQETVEHVLPRGGVHPGRVGDDAIGVEDHGPQPGQVESGHVGDATQRRRPQTGPFDLRPADLRP